MTPSQETAQRMATFVPPPMHKRYRERAAKMGLSLAAYLRITLSRVDRELQQEEEQ